MFWQNAYAGTIALPQASNHAHLVDNIHDFLFWISVFFQIVVTVGMLYFLVKFHKSKKGRKTEYILGSHLLETIWTVGPLLLMLGIFVWGYWGYLKMREPVANAYEVNVIGRKWMWNFQYANGKSTLNELYLPKDRDVKLIMTSEDVIHSFFIPNFRIKQDVVPGMYTSISFRALIAGEHPVYCTEYCGAGHSDMLAKVVVLEQADFDNWLLSGKLPKGSSGVAMAASGAPAPAKSLADKGKDLFQNKGCFACHSVDGTPKVGPSLKGIWGKTEEMADGSKITVDENYVRESLNEPNKKVVKGFAPSMPTFKGLMSDEEINSMIAYIKSLKETN